MRPAADTDSLAWLFSLERLGMKFGLENMRALTAALEHPEAAYHTVLIAGTNGKGSVTAMVETGLRHGGYRTGRYTSPHLTHIEERFTIQGADVATVDLRAAVARIRSMVDTLLRSGVLEATPTFFEVTTAVAFELFRSANVDIAVLEVGLGGRLDATNVVAPLVTAITTIALDHQAQLGSSLASIAAEKAGIIKQGVPVVIGRLPDEAARVISEIAHTQHAPLVRAHEEVPALGDVQPALAGAHQIDNAIVALSVLRQLDQRGYEMTSAAERAAVERVTWPGRLERHAFGRAEVLIDAAHNPAGARALASYVKSAGWTGATLVFGAMADKDVQGMLTELAPVVSTIVCTTAPTGRAASASSIAETARRVTGALQVSVIEDPAAALEAACARSTRVVIAGSMFLIGPLRDILR